MAQATDPLRQEFILQAQRVSFGYAEPLLHEIDLE